MEAVMFFIAALGAIGGAVAVVALKNPFFSVLALVVHLLALAILFLLLYAEFLAAAQLIVYAGAVMVLYVFVVSYVGGSGEPLESAGATRVFAPFFGGALLLVFALAIGGSALKALDTRGAELAAGFGSPGAIGELLLTKFLLPFEIASYLLTIAAVGAVMLARRRRGLEELDSDGAAR
ncbi:MAG TPA: NADH-quinone oxidoreductase subunit J [Solirubrobacterales bacterium]|jgi:NADH:ubiquinone oxidoreductase subunit 6 (subunit J)|nr:NADH-quinone oxidoreductase subunit J [Solirubrobacterales bacterium]